jgi:hypothetical protein
MTRAFTRSCAVYDGDRDLAALRPGTNLGGSDGGDCGDADTALQLDRASARRALVADMAAAGFAGAPVAKGRTGCREVGAHPAGRRASGGRPRCCDGDQLNAPVYALTTPRPLTAPASVRPLEAALAPHRTLPTKAPDWTNIHRLPVRVVAGGRTMNSGKTVSIRAMNIRPCVAH